MWMLFAGSKEHLGCEYCIGLNELPIFSFTPYEKKIQFSKYRNRPIAAQSLPPYAIHSSYFWFVPFKDEFYKYGSGPQKCSHACT